LALPSPSWCSTCCAPFWLAARAPARWANSIRPSGGINECVWQRPIAWLQSGVVRPARTRQLAFGAKLIDLAISALAGAESALALDHWRKRALARLADRNPFRNIS